MLIIYGGVYSGIWLLALLAGAARGDPKAGIALALIVSAIILVWTAVRVQARLNYLRQPRAIQTVASAPRAFTNEEAAVYAMLLARLRALAAKTVKNGCTPGEALVARLKLMQLLAFHRIGLEELDAAADRVSPTPPAYRPWTPPPVDAAAMARQHRIVVIAACGAIAALVTGVLVVAINVPSGAALACFSPHPPPGCSSSR